MRTINKKKNTAWVTFCLPEHLVTSYHSLIRIRAGYSSLRLIPDLDPHMLNAYRYQSEKLICSHCFHSLSSRHNELPVAVVVCFCSNGELCQQQQRKRFVVSGPSDPCLPEAKNVCTLHARSVA
jgi:hypothetical protein